MKKILVALGIVAICLCSCNNNITNPEVDEPNNETKTETPSTNGTLDDEKSNCLINISAEGSSTSSTNYATVDYLQLNSLTIKDENGRVVGTGDYWGSYYVPYDGTLTINWSHREYRNYSFITSEYTFNVRSAHQLDVVVYNSYSGYCSIIVGGSVVASFEHDVW